MRISDSNKPGAEAHHRSRAANAAAVAGGLAALVALWALAAALVDTELILPRPDSVARSALELFGRADFMSALLATFRRGLTAFAISMLLGTAIGAAGAASPVAKAALAPLMIVTRSMPVLALILIALIWFKADVVPIFSAVLMGLPVVASAVEEGARAMDRTLTEMAELYRVGRAKRFFRLYLPSLTPYFAAAAQASLGMAWKVVVAGEVLSMPKHAVGTGMQTARVKLETAEVFAWALAGIALCALTDAAFGFVRATLRRRHAV